MQTLAGCVAAGGKQAGLLGRHHQAGVQQVPGDMRDGFCFKLYS